jgi:hypothetical protein
MDPLTDLMSGSVGGLALILFLRKALGGHPIPFDEDYFNQRCRRSWENMLYKDPALNASKRNKTDPSTPEAHADLLLKQQIIKKVGKVYSKAKAPQILTEHVHRVALDLAPVFMYCLYKVQELVAGSNVYFHPGHSDKDLAEFIRTHWNFSEISTEDDAEAWDCNMDAPFIQLELWLLEFLNIPKDLQLRFTNYKMNMKCALGPIAYMMFSGGPDTLPFNTIASYCFQNIRYDIPSSVAEIYGGDDVAINSKLSLSPAWTSLLHQHFHHVLKTNHTRHPIAFGWTLKPTPHKCPKTILGRALTAACRNKMAQTLPDLIADTATLSSTTVYESCSPEEQDIIDFLAPWLSRLSTYFHLEKQGITQGKVGSRRYYSVENMAAHESNTF